MCTFRVATLCRTTLAAVPAFAALAVIASPARLEAQATVYYACYVPSSGTVYRIKEPDLPQQCGSSSRKGVTVQHVEFSWTDGQGGQNTPADHSVLAGLSDDDHPQYLLAGGTRTAVNGFAVDGTYGQGSIPATGPGARLMWYPGKAALRAGFIQTALWDDSNIGSGSVALGSDVAASGIRSMAFGTGAVASGPFATAIGQLTKAQGGASTAIGYFTTASSDFSTAIGENSTASGYKSMALGSYANTNGRTGAVVMSTGAYGVEVKPATDYQFVARARSFWFGNNENVTAPNGQLIATSTGAYLTVGGAWVNSSDVNRKANFVAVGGEEVLGKIAALPIQTWNYRDEDTTTRHMGPTAQDFRAAFGLGANETSISTVDADGVSLAAIQALEKRTAELRRDNESLRAQVQALTERVDAMQRAGRSNHR